MAKSLNSPVPLDGPRRGVSPFKGRAASLWHAYPRETLGAGLFGLVAAGAIGTTVLSSLAPASHALAVPPAVPPMVIRPLAPARALKVNAQIPLTSDPNPSATPFKFRGNSAARTQALSCLASAVYYEAGNQDEDGERAVAQVVLNRVRHPAFPASICNVVYEGSTKPTGCQFTFTCDGSLGRRPDPQGWRQAEKVAEEALKGYVYAPVGWATHYHADYVVPYWAANMAKNAIIGAHLFYRWSGGWGQPAVFRKTYPGKEPSANALRAAALAVPHISPAYGENDVREAIKDIPGAEVLKLAPSLRGDKRVAVRFNLVARKASDEVKHEAYANQFEVSDNLKWSLSDDPVAENQQPLGRSGQAQPSSTGQR